MQLLLNLEKETVEDLRRSIEVLEMVISNKENGRVFSEGLEKFHGKPALPEWLMEEEAKRKSVPEEVHEAPVDNVVSEKMEDQKKMMESVDLSEILRNKK